MVGLRAGVSAAGPPGGQASTPCSPTPRRSRSRPSRSGSSRRRGPATCPAASAGHRTGRTELLPALRWPTHGHDRPAGPAEATAVRRGGADVSMAARRKVSARPIRQHWRPASTPSARVGCRDGRCCSAPAASCSSSAGCWRSSARGGTRSWTGPRALGAAATRSIALEVDDVTSVPTDPPIESALFELQGAENVVDRFANTAWATRWLDRRPPGSMTRPTRTSCQPEPMTDSYLVFDFDEPIGPLADPHPRRPSADDQGRELFSRPRVLELSSVIDARAATSFSRTRRVRGRRVRARRASTAASGSSAVNEPSEPSEMVEISEIVFEE